MAMSEYDPGVDTHDHDDWSEPPKWPKVVGIISIVWAVLGIVCNGLGTVMVFMTPQLMKMAEEQMEGGFPPQLMQPDMIMAGITTLSLLLAIGLLLAGIFTVNRRPQGRPMHLGVAVGSLILLVIAMALQWKSMNAMGEWVTANPDTTFAQQYSPMQTLISMALGIVIGGAWPAFLLIWFGALKKRPEIGAPEVL